MVFSRLRAKKKDRALRIVNFKKLFPSLPGRCDLPSLRRGDLQPHRFHRFVASRFIRAQPRQQIAGHQKSGRLAQTRHQRELRRIERASQPHLVTDRDRLRLACHRKGIPTVAAKLQLQRIAFCVFDLQPVNALAQAANARELIGKSQLKLLRGQNGDAAYVERVTLRRDSINAAGKLGSVADWIGLSERLIERE